MQAKPTLRISLEMILKSHNNIRRIFPRNQVLKKYIEENMKKDLKHAGYPSCIALLEFLTWKDAQKKSKWYDWLLNVLI